MNAGPMDVFDVSDPAEQGRHGDRDMPVDERGEEEKPPINGHAAGVAEDEPPRRSER